MLVTGLDLPAEAVASEYCAAHGRTCTSLVSLNGYEAAKRRNPAECLP